MDLQTKILFKSNPRITGQITKAYRWESRVLMIELAGNSLVSVHELYDVISPNRDEMFVVSMDRYENGDEYRRVYSFLEKTLFYTCRVREYVTKITRLEGTEIDYYHRERDEDDIILGLGFQDGDLKVVDATQIIEDDLIDVKIMSRVLFKRGHELNVMTNVREWAIEMTIKRFRKAFENLRKSYKMMEVYIFVYCQATILNINTKADAEWLFLMPGGRMLMEDDGGIVFDDEDDKFVESRVYELYEGIIKNIHNL